MLKRFAAIAALSHSSTKFVSLCEKPAPEYSSTPFRKIPVTNDTRWNGTVVHLEVFRAEWKVINGALGAYADSKPRKTPPSKLNQCEVDLGNALLPILLPLDGVSISSEDLPASGQGSCFGQAQVSVAEALLLPDWRRDVLSVEGCVFVGYVFESSGSELNEMSRFLRDFEAAISGTDLSLLGSTFDEIKSTTTL